MLDPILDSACLEEGPRNLYFSKLPIMILMCSQCWEPLLLRARVWVLLALWWVTRCTAPCDGFSALIYLFWICRGMSIISTVTMQALLTFVFFSFPLFTSNSDIGSQSFRPPGQGENTRFPPPLGYRKFQYPFSGGYSTVQITGKTIYENREDLCKGTLAASLPWFGKKVNPGIHYKCIAFQDWPSYLIQLLQNKLSYTKLVRRRGFVSFLLR